MTRKVLYKGLKAFGYNGIKNVNEFLAEKLSPEDAELEFQGLNLIEIPESKCINLIADIPGNIDYYGLYINLFLYTDGKVLGKAHYIKEANLPEENISGTYIFKNDTYFLLIEWISSDTSISNYIIVLNLQDKIQTEINRTQQEKVNQSLKNEEVKNDMKVKRLKIQEKKVDSNVILFSGHTDSALLFLCSQLTRFGWEVILSKEKNAISIKKIRKKNTLKIYIAYAVRNFNWKLKKYPGMEKDFHVFIVLPKQTYEEIGFYNIPGSTIKKWMLNSSDNLLKLNYKDARVEKYLDDWHRFES